MRNHHVEIEPADCYLDVRLGAQEEHFLPLRLVVGDSENILVSLLGFQREGPKKVAVDELHGRVNVRDTDALAKLQVRTGYRLNLSRNIKVLEGCQKIPKGCTMFQKECTVEVLVGAQ